MLEKASLLLMPWVIPAPPKRMEMATRRILDADTDQPLGLARRHGSLWSGKLTRLRLEILETEDESLVSTWHGPSWLRRAWEARDADNVLIGHFRKGRLWDRLGRVLAEMRHDGEDEIYFLTPGGQELAALVRKVDGWALTFAAELENEPFVKMLLLGAALAETQ